MRMASIGEVLWDVLPEGEYLGGAPCNLAAHAARLGNEAILVSAVGEDPRGAAALGELARLGVNTDHVGVVAGVPTGVVSVTRDAQGEPTYSILRPVAYDRLCLSDATREVLSGPLDWLAFGTLLFTHPKTREFLDLALSMSRGTRRFYDVNLREGHYSWPLVEDLIHAADVLKLNEPEARWVQSSATIAAADLESLCRQLAPAFQLDTICVTRGAQGCALLHHNDYIEVPGIATEVVDTVGAGDAFSAMFLHGLSAGWLLTDVARRANALGAFVASRKGAVPEYDPETFRNA